MRNRHVESGTPARTARPPVLPDLPDLDAELAGVLQTAIKVYERRRELRRRAREQFATARKIGKARGHVEKLRRAKGTT